MFRWKGTRAPVLTNSPTEPPEAHSEGDQRALLLLREGRRGHVTNEVWCGRGGAGRAGGGAGAARHVFSHRFVIRARFIIKAIRKEAERREKYDFPRVAKLYESAWPRASRREPAARRDVGRDRFGLTY
ncbi:hypothetical protein EVAR_63766_1 [Eumeta japonica]|uniref:Uncharacterized protein n=1 Tax=Eumeta variegata TaxID=151549 RepID=A0A4C1ZSG5_EUMVA|nr:hypothetical protein EVAR_63766_1 [Eumeta japonica]